jgi:hypothetical protein
MITVTHDEQRYRVERTEGYARGTVVERFAGMGLIGSHRRWLGTHFARSVTWWAAVNPTLELGRRRTTGRGSRPAVPLSDGCSVTG